jgi:hypothetical protein
MADFGEICPLFNTGLFNEITFPNLALTGFSTECNALIGTVSTTSTLLAGWFTFGRTVVVTGAYVRRNKTSTTGDQVYLDLQYRTSPRATPSTIGTYIMSLTSDQVDQFSWVPMAVTAHTFTSTDVLGFSLESVQAASAGTYDLIVRYKEK